MQKRDVLLYEIEQIGRLISRLLDGFRADNSFEIKNIEETNNKFKAEINLDIEHLVSQNKKETETYFETTIFTSEHLDYIANYLTEASEAFLEEKGQIYLAKALDIIEIVNETSQSISFGRMALESKIKSRLKPN